MVEKKKKSASNKKGKKGYSDEIRAKAVELAKQGKTVSDIVAELNGPKPKAVMRYLETAGVKYNKK